jgi:acyl-CoA synthetase (AMP-forming)/AMP-acid ligase II
MTSASPEAWGDDIVVETIGRVPFHVYAQRPRRVEHLLAFTRQYGTRSHIVQRGTALSFDQLHQLSEAKGQVLKRAGIQGGDRVLLLGWNSAEWVTNFWACVWVAAVPVLANAWWSAGELAAVVDDIEPALILADADGAKKLQPHWRQGLWDTDGVVSPAGDADGLRPAGDSVDEGAPAAIIFTSGTEGRPKGVVLSHRALLAGLQMLLHITRRLPSHQAAGPGEIALHTGPLFHIGGIQTLLRTVVLGGTLVMPGGGFDSGEALELIERHRVTRWAAVTTMVTRLLDDSTLPRRDLSSLRALTVGGGPVHPEFLARVRAGLPGVNPRITTGYGLTENGGQATAASGAETEDHPGSCGTALPCVEIKISREAGAADGDILLRSPTQMTGYYGHAESPIGRDGWLLTGDRGYVDEAGHLWVTGRSKDLIIRGGENIAPTAVERALITIPGVTEAAVFGVPHRDLGEEVVAVVVAGGEQSADELRGQLRGQVSSFAIPSRWRVQTEPLPTNHAGKVDKAKLLAEAAHGTDSVRP